MLTKRIFLACSAELKDERQQFEILINRRNKQWVDQGMFLELVVWEDFLDAVSKTRLQDEYNVAIRQCDIFVMLFSTKVGPYTQEEFETAFDQFKATSKPMIFVYFKDSKVSLGTLNKKDLMSVLTFQEKLDSLGHFYTVYENVDGLKLHFTQQLEKLIDSGFLKLSSQDVAGSASPAIGQSGVAVLGANQGVINTGTQQIDTGGAAIVFGGVNTGGGNFIARDWNQQLPGVDDLDSLFAPVVAAVETSGAPADVRVDALRQAKALEIEIMKRHRADDFCMSRIVSQLAEAIPNANSAIVQLFGAPALVGVAGTMTRDAVDRLRRR